MEVNKFGIKDSDLKLILDVLKNYPEIKKAIIFGSRAMGNYKNGSDIDIAIYGENMDLILTKLWGELEENIAVPYKFDLIDFDKVESEKLKKHIRKYGKKIFKL